MSDCVYGVDIGECKIHEFESYCRESNPGISEHDLEEHISNICCAHCVEAKKVKVLQDIAGILDNIEVAIINR